MKVRDTGLKEVYYAMPVMSLDEVTSMMKRHGVGAVPVCDGDILNIKEGKKSESEVKKRDLYQSERVYGVFHRSLSLPSSVDASKIEAGCDSGGLEITLPKASELLT